MSTPIVSKDLSKRAPKSPRERISGFVILGRAIDKCRASLDGTLGNYHFDCPLDKMLFSFKGITAEQFKTAVAAAKTYEDVGEWLQANGTRKTPAEVNAWSDETEASSLMKDPEKRAYFIESCSRLMMNPEMNTTFDWLEADDARTSWPTTPEVPVSASTRPAQLPAAPGDQSTQNVQAPVPNSMGAPVFGQARQGMGQQTGGRRNPHRQRSKNRHNSSRMQSRGR
ncbi:MAG: DUF5069 domain-containing protein [Limisphaerales bacterium]